MTPEAWKEQAALEPCPFCGEAEKLSVKYYVAIDPNGFDAFYVRCDKCFARGPNVGVNDYDREPFKNEAAALWNNRLNEQSIRDDQREKDAGIAETYSWQDGKMTENSCCAATGCDIAAAIRQMKGEG